MHTTMNGNMDQYFCIGKITDMEIVLQIHISPDANACKTDIQVLVKEPVHDSNSLQIFLANGYQFDNAY